MDYRLFITFQNFGPQLSKEFLDAAWALARDQGLNGCTYVLLVNTGY